MQVINVNEEAFYELLDKMIKYIKDNQAKEENKWVPPKTAMSILGIKSKTSLQKLRNEGLIRYTQPERRIILYDRESLYEYLEAFAKAPFALKTNLHRK